MAAAAAPAAGTAVPGLPGPGELIPAAADPGHAAGGRPRFGAQAVKTDPVVMPTATQRGSDSGDVETRATDRGQESDAVLAESLPIDLAALNRALDHSLGQLDAIGDTVAGLLTSDGAWPWLAAAVVVSTASVVAVAWRRRDRFGPLAVDEGTFSPWFLDSNPDA
jgi:hypothetical protein